MKIEIELEDVERLKADIRDKDKEIRELKAELQSLDAKELRSQAVDLSKRLFDNYMVCVYKKLGFTGSSWRRDSVVEFKDNLEHYLGKSWWESDKIEINIGANISKQWRSAFLSLGIKTDSDLEK